jgi:hypothetical protein
MWTVQYRCLYREHWYDDSEHMMWEAAAARAMALVAMGRRVRIVDGWGRVVWQS